MHLTLAANLNHWYLRSAVAVYPAQQLAAEQRSLPVDALDFKQTTNQLANGGRQQINTSASRPNTRETESRSDVNTYDNYRI